MKEEERMGGKEERGRENIGRHRKVQEKRKRKVVKWIGHRKGEIMTEMTEGELRR